MKTSVLILFLVVLHQASPAVAQTQHSAENSIEKILNDKTADSTKVKALIQLAEALYSDAPDKAIECCKHALALAERTGFDEGIGEATGWLAFLYEQQGEISLTLEYYQRSLALARKLKSRKSEATILNNVAAIYKDLGRIDEALEYHNQSLKIRKALGDKKGIANSLNNLGLIYHNQGSVELALDTYMEALKIEEGLNNAEGIATVLQNIAFVYRDQKQYDIAYSYFMRALEVNRAIGDKYSTGYTLNGIGGLYELQNQPDSALLWFQQALRLRNEINDRQGTAYTLKNIGIIYKKKNNLTEAEQYFKNSLAKFEQLDDKWGTAITTNLLGGILLAQNRLSEAEMQLKRSLETARQLGYPTDISNAAAGLQALYRKQNNWKEALLMGDVFMQMHDSILNDANRKTALKAQFRYEIEKKEALFKSEQEKILALSNAEIKKQKIIRNSIAAGLLILALFSFVVIRQRNKISKEKKRSDELLLNILPAETAEELKSTGTAKAKNFEQVTVLFTDFKDFTSISEHLSAQELVNEINYCFSAFDKIISKYGIEKIKTIGDSYMCAGGLPVANETNAEDTVHAALEIRNFMLERAALLRQHKITKGRAFEIRIGIHTGSLVAGIVGIKKFAYDIWGDTVNIASRMESSGEPGKVNISESTYELVKDKFKCIPRGKVQAKSKGEIDMYFVDKA